MSYERRSEMKKLKEKDFPIWVISRLYAEVFPDKQAIASGVHEFVGTSFKYSVKLKHNIRESVAKVSDVEMYRIER